MLMMRYRSVSLCLNSWKNLFSSSCFHRSIGHVISRETENLQVPYYVDKNFEKNYQGAELQELERTVEKDYIDYIQTSCWKEKQQSKLFFLRPIISCTVAVLHKALPF